MPQTMQQSRLSHPRFIADGDDFLRHLFLYILFFNFNMRTIPFRLTGATDRLLEISPRYSGFYYFFLNDKSWRWHFHSFSILRIPHWSGKYETISPLELLEPILERSEFEYDDRCMYRNCQQRTNQPIDRWTPLRFSVLGTTLLRFLHTTDVFSQPRKPSSGRCCVALDWAVKFTVHGKNKATAKVPQVLVVNIPTPSASESLRRWRIKPFFLWQGPLFVGCQGRCFSLGTCLRESCENGSTLRWRSRNFF